MSNKAFKKIKKQNGEEFAKNLRNIGVLGVENIENIVKHAGRNFEDIKDYLISLKNIKIEEHGAVQDPIVMLKKAGYHAEYITSYEQQQSYKKYYAEGEELCTFNDPKRFENFHMIWCVRDGWENTPRGNPPKRDDPYATDVICIQIAKTGGFISIKNHYNHSVEDCDNTLDSNPDNIIKGLSNSMRHMYKTDFSSQAAMLPKNYINIDNKILKYNQERNDVYFGDDFYVKNGTTIELDKSNEIMIDNIILNLKSKEITDPAQENSSFIKALQQEIKDKKLQVTKDEDGNKHLTADGINILTFSNSQLTAINFPNVTEIDADFCRYNKSLKSINLPEAISIKDNFCRVNKNLGTINLPKVETIGDSCFTNAQKITEINLPSVATIGDSFFSNAKNISKASLPQLEEIGKRGFASAEGISIDAPNLNQEKASAPNRLLSARQKLSATEQGNADNSQSQNAIKNTIVQQMLETNHSL